MPKVQLKPGHPYGEYRRGGLVFTAEEQEVDEDAEGYNDIINDPFLIVDGKTLAQRAPKEPEGEVNTADLELKEDGKTDVKVTEDGSAKDNTGSGVAAAPTNPVPSTTAPSNQAKGPS